MIERDYILRMIQMLVQALTNILFYKKGEQYPEALEEIRKASKQIIGVELDVFRKLSDSSMIDMLSLDLSLGIPKVYAAGVLLKEEAEILDAQGFTGESVEARNKSLSLLTESALRSRRNLDSGHAQAIEALAAKVGKNECPIHIRKKLFYYYYEIAAQFSKAEDVLYDILDQEPGFVEEGIRFYERLLKKNDEEIGRGGLPRVEVEDGLRDLQRKLKFRSSR